VLQNWDERFTQLHNPASLSLSLLCCTDLLFAGVRDVIGILPLERIAEWFRVWMHSEVMQHLLSLIRALVFSEVLDVRDWVRQQFMVVIELSQGADLTIKDEAVQLLCLFLPELLAHQDVFQAILNAFPFKDYYRVTESLVRSFCALPFPELSRDICTCVCFALGRLLALPIPERVQHKVQNEIFSELFCSLVTFLGLRLEDFQTDAAGQRRIAAVFQ
jgi:hypothetical protein